MKEVYIYNYIDKLMQDVLENPKQDLVANHPRQIVIHDVEFELHIWSENFEEKVIQVFELRRKKFFFEAVYTKGILFETDSTTILSNEDMLTYNF